MKFLIIIENQHLSRYIKRLILSNNEECLVADNIEDFITAIKKYNPDWIFIDLDLKNVNGFKLTETIKSKHTDISIALLSDFNDKRLRLKAEKVKASAFIPKENLYEFHKIIYERLNKG